MAKFVPTVVLFIALIGAILLVNTESKGTCTKTSKNFKGECKDDNECARVCKAELTGNQVLGGVCRDRSKGFNQSVLDECETTTQGVRLANLRRECSKKAQIDNGRECSCVVIC
ncbi:uncharacterized protein [Spinacia oleracea]|uniref:Defensin-like protein n=1 Tax=Spinacia oleracea TaxID=3562 RepID=A0ABM3R6Z5_SPIOL|nr:uncharacterized protein LOC130466833 [Spinacia oleracea]